MIVSYLVAFADNSKRFVLYPWCRHCGRENKTRELPKLVSQFCLDTGMKERKNTIAVIKLRV